MRSWDLARRLVRSCEARVRSLHHQTHYGAGPLGPFAGTLRDFKLEVGVALDAVELARRAAAPGL